MKKTVKQWTGRGVLIVILGLAAPMAMAGDRTLPMAPNPTPQQVQVVNTPQQPVPTVAQGTTAVSGTVSVGNTVTAHLDSNQVVVDNSLPLVTRDADGGAPVSARVTFQLGLLMVGAGGQYTVPAGKRLIVEHVSGRVTGGDDTQHERATLELGGGQGDLIFQRHFLIPSAIAGDDRLYSMPIRAYFGPGNFVALRVERDTAPTVLDAEFQLTGRLVDVP